MKAMASVEFFLRDHKDYVMLDQEYCDDFRESVECRFGKSPNGLFALRDLEYAYKALRAEKINMRDYLTLVRKLPADHKTFDERCAIEHEIAVEAYNTQGPFPRGEMQYHDEELDKVAKRKGAITAGAYEIAELHWDSYDEDGEFIGPNREIDG